MERPENKMPDIKRPDPKRAQEAARGIAKQASAGLMGRVRTFLAGSNALDLAVGVSGGVAFGELIKSFVEDVLMPPLGAITKGVNFSDLFINLSATPATSLADAHAKGLPVIAYGPFLQQGLRFAIVACALGFVARAINRFKRGAEPTPLVSKECPFCASAIPLKATRCPHCTSHLSGQADLLPDGEGNGEFEGGVAPAAT